MDTKQPEALRLAPCPFCGGGARRTTVGTNAWFGTGCDGDQSCPAHLRALTHKTQAEADAAWNRRTPPAAAELLRLRAENDAARLEIESLQSRLIHANEQHRLWFARSQELEAQLDAVGAGGVEPLRKRCLHQISEPEAQPVGVAPEWWRKRADEIETDVARGGSIAAMNCYTKMRQLLQAATSPQPAPQPAPQVQADAPVVLPEPVAYYDGERWYANEESAICACADMPKLQKVYTEQQVRAMLAAAPKLPAHEPLRCSCHTCWPIAADDPASTFMRLCPACGNKRCPKANDHRHACTGSNEPGQPGSAYQLTGGITAAQKGDAPK